MHCLSSCIFYVYYLPSIMLARYCELSDMQHADRHMETFCYVKRPFLLNYSTICWGFFHHKHLRTKLPSVCVCTDKQHSNRRHRKWDWHSCWCCAVMAVFSNQICYKRFTSHDMIAYCVSNQIHTLTQMEQCFKVFMGNNGRL